MYIIITSTQPRRYWTGDGWSFDRDLARKYDTHDEALAARRILGIKLTETRSTLGWY